MRFITHFSNLNVDYVVRSYNTARKTHLQHYLASTQYCVFKTDVPNRYFIGKHPKTHFSVHIPTFPLTFSVRKFSSRKNIVKMDQTAPKESNIAGDTEVRPSLNVSKQNKTNH